MKSKKFETSLKKDRNLLTLTRELLRQGII